MFQNVRYLVTKTSLTPQERLAAVQWLEHLTPDQSLLRHFTVSYTHSSGKGGQHVNTSDTKAQMRMSAGSWYGARGSWINQHVFDEVMYNYSSPKAPQSKKFPFFTVSGDVLVESQRTRYQSTNLQDCLDKFVSSIKQCGQLREDIDDQTKQTWHKYKQKENEQRLKRKKMHKDKKQFRSKVKMDDY